MKALLLLLPTCLVAQSGLDRPSLGEMIDRNGVLRPVSGVAGSFLVEAPKAKGVLASACLQAVCVSKTKDSLLAGGAIIPAPLGGAVIGLDGSGAVVYFAGANQFARLQSGFLTPLDLTVEGEILSLRSTPGGIELAVRRANGIWIQSSNGDILDSLPVTATTALLLSKGIVYATADELVLRRADGNEQRFPAPGVRDLFAISDGWAEARSDVGIFALRTDVGLERLYVLPEPQAARERRQ